MPAVAYQLPASQVVLSTRQHTFHVYSDNAWLDSGSGFIVEAWDREAKKTVTHRVHTGRASYGPEDTWDVEPAVNATAEDFAAAAAYDAAMSFMMDVYGIAEKAHYIRQGGTVEVIKGRKAPKGRYEVASHGNGNYGPYVNLRTTDGKWINFVSVENIKVVPDYARVFAEHGLGKRNPEFIPFIGKAAETNWSGFGWGVLADYLEEQGEEICKVPATDFANALRRIANDTEIAPKFSTYYADCHNEYRRPFSGR